MASEDSELDVDSIFKVALQVQRREPWPYAKGARPGCDLCFTFGLHGVYVRYTYGLPRVYVR